ncbi:MAG: type II CRISPR RNA-guided endonuclease Cas9, partial [Bacteroidetes bacterium]|nr:type II CRISPR RNA-guided endonuclease Cas9 [Bacteroidota bacterium]
MGNKILGLDLGTNSIGWALIEQNFDNKEGKILGMGSRIIPMDAGEMGKFAEGSKISKTADRTNFRGIRRLRERNLLRRERLHRVLNVLDFLPEHFASQIDFTKRFGKFKEETEPKLAYHNTEFIFKKSFQEMLEEFRIHQPELVSNGKLIPYDWTIYYLRKKALTKVLEKEELAWL